MASKQQLGKVVINRGKKTNRKTAPIVNANEYSERYQEALQELEEFVGNEKTAQQIFDDIQAQIEEDIGEEYDIPNLFKEPDSNEECYDVIGQIVEFMAFYRETKDLDKAVQTFAKSYEGNYRHISRANPILQKIFQKVDDLRILEEFTEGLEGVGECLICFGKKIEVKIQSTRSADEALTVLYRCSNCRAAGRNIRLLK